MVIVALLYPGFRLAPPEHRVGEVKLLYDILSTSYYVEYNIWLQLMNIASGACVLKVCKELYLYNV